MNEYIRILIMVLATVIGLNFIVALFVGFHIESFFVILLAFGATIGLSFLGAMIKPEERGS